jgi:hypothetical protein
MKILPLAEPVNIKVPGGTLTATHAAELIVDKIGISLKHEIKYFVLKDPALAGEDMGDFLPVGPSIVTDLRGDAYENLIKEDGPKARGNYWVSDVRAEVKQRKTSL